MVARYSSGITTAVSNISGKAGRAKALVGCRLSARHVLRALDALVDLSVRQKFGQLAIGGH
jgi:hypothetical protein